MSRKTICFWGFCLILGIAVGVLIPCLGKITGKDNVEKWKLKQAIVYDNEMKSALDELNAQGMNFVFWKKSSEELENEDFCRKKEVDAYGIVGNTSVLFPNSNGLCYGEKGFCILSDDVAVELFGSIDVVGRSITLRGIQYKIAGIETKTKNFCAYELAPEDNAKVTNVGCQAESKAQLWQMKQILSNL